MPVSFSVMKYTSPSQPLPSGRSMTYFPATVRPEGKSKRDVFLDGRYMGGRNLHDGTCGRQTPSPHQCHPERTREGSRAQIPREYARDDMGLATREYEECDRLL